MDDANEKGVMREIYMHLLPFALCAYSFCYIERINVSFAGLTMRSDLGLPATEFGFAAESFYWGYFLFEAPSNIVMEKVGARLWIARIMITWGIAAACMALVVGPNSFYLVRLLLGAADAGHGEGHPRVEIPDSGCWSLAFAAAYESFRR